MILLDENILQAQRMELEAWRIRVRQIGANFGTKGLQDEQIIVQLRELGGCTFFTRDAGFYKLALRHRSYCLVVLSVGQHEVARFIRRFLRYPRFDTRAKRMGSVVRISPAGLVIWKLGQRGETRDTWAPPPKWRP